MKTNIFPTTASTLPKFTRFYLHTTLILGWAIGNHPYMLRRIKQVFTFTSTSQSFLNHQRAFWLYDIDVIDVKNKQLSHPLFSLRLCKKPNTLSHWIHCEHIHKLNKRVQTGSYYRSRWHWNSDCYCLGVTLDTLYCFTPHTNAIVVIVQSRSKCLSHKPAVPRERKINIFGNLNCNRPAGHWMHWYVRLDVVEPIRRSCNHAKTLHSV